jgi:3-methylcrotonyl-CoA carboxylase alpha subunit
MIAKIIAHGSDREDAARRLSAALAETEVSGLQTNRAFLKALIDHPAFLAAEIDTGFIVRHGGDLVGGAKPMPGHVLAVAALALIRKAERDNAAAADPADPFSPWARIAGWRLNGEGTTAVHLRDRTGEVRIAARYGPTSLVLALPGGAVEVDGSLSADDRIDADIAGVRLSAQAVFADGSVTIFCAGAEWRSEIVDPLKPATERSGATGHLRSPMPGTVIAVAVAAGDSVAKGAPLVIVEAMKMEHAVVAPRDGTIARVAVSVGDLVAEGAELVTMEEGA